MKDQLQTIREALESALSDDQPYIEKCKQALTALAQLEAMVGEQEPVHWRAVLDPEQAPQQLKTTMHVVGFREKKAAEGFVAEQIDFYGWRYTIEPLYAAPVAQQPQCHKRANDYCKCSRKAMLCDGFGSAQQPQATCITITHAQAAELMLMFSGAEPDAEITLLTGDGHSGPGLYAYYEEYPEEGAEKLDATELPAQQPQADRERCIEARNALNEALHGPGALIDSLEEAVEAACRKLKQPQAEMHRYSPDGEGGMEIDSLGAWVKLRDVKQQPQAEVITEALIDAYLDDYEMRGETENGRDVCYTPSEGEKFLIKDAIMGLLAEIPPKQPQAEAVRPIEQERREAEQQYSITAFNYPDAPIGSRDWTLYWAGWLARSTAFKEAPQRAEAVPTTHVLVPVELLNRVLDSEEVNEMADASDELRAMIAAAKKEAGHE